MIPLLAIACCAIADQLEWVKQADAQRAVEFLSSQDELLLYCGCCDNDPQRYVRLTGVGKNTTGTDNYFEIAIVGEDVDGLEVRQNIDLAYAYVNKSGKAQCVGKALGLECDPCRDDFDWNSPRVTKPETPKPQNKPATGEKPNPLLLKGEWTWGSDKKNENGDAESALRVKVYIDGTKISGGFDGYAMFGNRVEGGENDYACPINGLLTADGAICSYQSCYSDNKGNVKLIILNNNEMKWLIKNYATDSWVPSEVILTRKAESLTDLSEPIQQINSIYTTTGLDEYLKKLLPATTKIGIIPIDNLIPDVESASVIAKEDKGVDPLSGTSLSRTQYSTGVIVDEIDPCKTSYYYTSDFKTKHFNLMSGMTKEEVKKLLGIPFLQRPTLLVYVTPDVVEEEYNPVAGKKHYYGGVRLLFENDKLSAIWLLHVSCINN